MMCFRFSHAFAVSRKFVFERSDSMQAAGIHHSGFLQERKKTEAFRCLPLALNFCVMISGRPAARLCTTTIAVQVFHLAGANNNKMSVPAIMTVGVVSVGTPELVEDLLDFDGISKIHLPFQPSLFRDSQSA